jgi:hypothetical protein
MIKLQKGRLMGMNKGTSSNSTVSFLELSGAQKCFNFTSEKVKPSKGSWQDAKKKIRKKSSSSHDEEDIVVGCRPGKR